MQILSATDIRNWDAFTIEQEPIASIDLMERAASECVEWIQYSAYANGPYHIFCGKGNNGGDGLVIARMLAEAGQMVLVHILEYGYLGTQEFQTNLSRLHQVSQVDIKYIQSPSHFPVVNANEIIIDAILGTGLNRPLDKLSSELVTHINQSGATVISIDIPTGMHADNSSKNTTVIKATHTLSFQACKLAMLMPENAPYLGDLHILDIGLHPEFLRTVNSLFYWIGSDKARTLFKPRHKFAHKGQMGHALLVAGSYGKMGAAVLSATGCMRSGVGLLTCHVPGCGLQIMQTVLPEAMVLTDFNSSYCTRMDGDFSKYQVIGIGPGLGTAQETRTLLKEVLQQWRGKLVLDADALNCISIDKSLLNQLPEGSILTPHPKELERLFGSFENDFERLEIVLREAKKRKLVIILKGHFTCVATPDGQAYFNSTGNAGMATAGSGDLLTGILTGLLAQGYDPVSAALLGVYIHGLAGDIAADKLSMESMLASDIASHLGSAFRRLYKNQE